MFSDCEDDLCIFVCGTCKRYFTQLSAFAQHKKEKLCQKKFLDEQFAKSSVTDNHIAEETSEEIDSDENAYIQKTPDTAEGSNGPFMKNEALLMKAIIGENVFFNCNFTIESLFTTLRFSKDKSFKVSERIAYKQSKGPLVVDESFEGRLSVATSGLLMLRNVSKQDEGFYRCNVELREVSKLEPQPDEVELKVGVPPVIEPFSFSNISIFEGGNLEIICKVTGQPAPYVFWSGYRQAIKDMGTRNHILKIRDAKPSDSGLYRCLAANFMGTAERSLEIRVHRRPKVSDFFNTASLDGTIYECQNVEFTCEARGNEPPVDKFHFYHNGRLIREGSKKGVFNIDKVRKKDEGIYSCVPQSKLAIGLNRTIELKVIASPENCSEVVSSLPAPVTSTQDGSIVTDCPATLSPQPYGSKPSGCERRRFCSVTFFSLLLHSVSFLYF